MVVVVTMLRVLVDRGELRMFMGMVGGFSGHATRSEVSLLRPGSPGLASKVGPHRPARVELLCLGHQEQLGPAA